MKKILLVLCFVFLGQFTISAQGLGKIWKQQKERSSNMMKKDNYKRKEFFKYYDKKGNIKIIKAMGFKSPVDTTFRGTNIMLFQKTIYTEKNSYSELFLLKKGTDTIPQYVGYIGGFAQSGSAQFRTLVSKYLADCSKLIALINSGDKKYRNPMDIKNIVKFYENCD